MKGFNNSTMEFTKTTMGFTKFPKDFTNTTEGLNKNTFGVKKYQNKSCAKHRLEFRARSALNF